VQVGCAESISNWSLSVFAGVLIAWKLLQIPDCVRKTPEARATRCLCPCSRKSLRAAIAQLRSIDLSAPWSRGWEKASEDKEPFESDTRKVAEFGKPSLSIDTRSARSVQSTIDFAEFLTILGANCVGRMTFEVGPAQEAKISCRCQKSTLDERSVVRCDCCTEQLSRRTFFDPHFVEFR